MSVSDSITIATLGQAVLNTQSKPQSTGPTADRTEAIASDIIAQALTFIRQHLDMEVAYLSEFVGDDIVFRAVDAPGFEQIAHIGASFPVDQVYCRHIIEGRLPELIPDTSQIPLCQQIPYTASVPIGAHLSIPIHRPDGSAYGMFCCLRRRAHPDLNNRDLEVMRAFAGLAAEQIGNHLEKRTATETTRTKIQDMMDQERFSIVYQPIMDAQNCAPHGFEALCRFHSDPYRPPNLWFEDARRVGLQVDLEIKVIEKALTFLKDLPPDIYISVNASPETVASGALMECIQHWPADRILVELTEHHRVDDYETLLAQIALLRFAGARIAIDDVGAGYSGLQQIVRLRPDVIKLDVSLTNNINADIVRRSLSSALVTFGKEIDAMIVAEGIETGAELEALRQLGVPLAQGYFLGRPQPMADALAFVQEGVPPKGQIAL